MAPTFPTLATARLTSPFGWRTHPITGVQTFHSGIDLAPQVAGTTGVPVYAAQGGIVVRRQYNSSMGNYIMIKHTDDTYTTHYLHLAEYMVDLYDTVAAGQQIGIMGTSGNSTGIHLDFGVSTTFPTVFGSSGTYIDPVPYLNNAIVVDPEDPDTGSPDPIIYKNIQNRRIHRRRR